MFNAVQGRLVPLVFTVLFFTASFAAAQPIYIEAGGGIESGIIDTYRLGRTDDYYSSFKPVFFSGIHGEFGKHYNFKLNYKNDSFWQNTVNAGMGFTMGVIQAGMGVQIGGHDTKSGYKMLEVEYWNIGLDGRIKVELPGYFFIAGDFILDIGGGNWVSNKTGSAHRQMLSFYAGFWLPHIIISGGYSGKNFDAIISDTVASRADIARYWAKLDIFAKNIPFRILMEGGALTQKANTSDDSSGVVQWNTPVSKTSPFASLGISCEAGMNIRIFANSQILFSPFNFSLNGGIEIKIEGNK